MAIGRLIARVLPGSVLRFAQGLRYPQVFLLILAVFLLDMLVPDFIPLLDEILLGLVTVFFAAWKKRKDRS